MNTLPGKEDFIDIHTHGAEYHPGIFSIENLMAHEKRNPVLQPGIAYTYGIHPWYLDESNHNKLISSVIKLTADPAVIAVGEAGFDKIKGPSMDLQRKTFEEQIIISEDMKKPLVIHCVRSWDELLASLRKIKPRMPWLVHGFRGKADLALQLISKGFYLSFWFDYVMRPEMTALIKRLPAERLFFETDGADISISDIYYKVSEDLGIGIEKLKEQVLKNFISFFNVKEYKTTCYT